MKNLRKLRLLLFLAIAACTAATASGQAIRMFNADDNLSSSLINQLYQDRNGIMWIATEDGLNRYDGNKFTSYRHIPNDSTSLCNNFVKSLFEDSDGQLYVCTRRGLQIYDPATDRFLPRLRRDSGKGFNFSINHVIKRSDNEYWTIGDSLVRFAPGKRTVSDATTADELSATLRNAHCAIVDTEKHVWVSNGSELYRVAPDNSMRHYFGKKDDPVVSSMAIGRDGLLYIGTTSKGLMRFNRDRDSFESLTPGISKEIKALFSDSNGDIIQAIDGDGITFYTPATGTNRKFRFSHNKLGPDRQKAHTVLRDADGNIWTGIYQSGIVLMPGQSNSFGYIGYKSERYDVIGKNCVSAICRSHDGNLWVGSDNDGIYSLNDDMSLQRHYYSDEIASPMCIFEDSRGEIWVGTYLHGVGTLDRSTGNMRRLDISDNSRHPGNVCFAITEDRDHNVWLGMLNSGLVKYDIKTGRVIKDFSWRDKIDLWIASLYYSPKTNSLYIGSYSGLQVVDNVSLAEPGINTFFTDDVVYSIDEGPDGCIWLATTNGIIRFNPTDGSSRRYTMADGLHSTTAYAIRHDGHHIWISLNSGLTRFDPATETFSNFLVSDGLQGNEFYKNSAFKAPDGRLYFGGIGGITHFNPRDIASPGRKWAPRVAGFYLHGAPASVGTPVYEASEFRLEPDEDSFSIEFGTRQLGRPESVLFAYAIDDKAWETLPAGTNIVNFHRLEPGKHTLRFKTVDNLTESEVKTLSIAVAHPWYATAWAKALYAAAALLLAVWAAYSYAARLRHRTELLNLTHAEQINEARLQSFVNMSHEIRTPMSLVISPLQKLLATDTDPSRRHEYGLILRNAKRILRHIDELMDLRKIEKRQMRLSLRRTQLVPFIDDIRETFAQVMAGKNIAFSFNYDSSDTSACIDAANFDKIMMNLLSNAVKYTPECGRISIDLERTPDDMVRISVTDTGIGVPDKDKQRIFDRFYQAHGNAAGGTGVGLHLTQQLVALHHGTIVATDNPDGNEGTRFIVTIPAGQEDTGESDAASTAIPGARPTRHGLPFNDPKSLLVPDIDESPAETAHQQAERVLIVEDDEEIRRYLRHELSAKYRVSCCTGGREALDTIFRQAPDLIVSDIMMPEMDGICLTRTIKQNINLNHIPVILVTAMSRDEDNIAAIEAGADDFVTKPFNIEILKSKISGLLTRYRLLKNRYSGSQEHDDKIDKISVESNDEKLMKRIMAVINREMANPDLTVELLASEVGLSRVHLHRRLKALTNQSPRDFIRNTRLRQAATLLSEKRLSVAEVSDLTGFSNAGSFTTAFKRLFGTTPSEYAENKAEASINN